MPSLPTNPPAPIITRIPVRFRDCDPLGHVNNAVYLTYFELARIEFWNAVMHPESPADFPFILAEATVTYRSPALFGELLEVDISVDSIGNRSWTFRYCVRETASQREVAVGRTVQVAYDYRQHSSMPVPASMRSKLESYLSVAPR